jgi:hypothetical protein
MTNKQYRQTGKISLFDRENHIEKLSKLGQSTRKITQSD